MRLLLLFVLLLAVPVIHADELPDKPQPRPGVQRIIEYPAVTVRDAVTFKDKQASTLAAVEAGFLISDGITTRQNIKQGGYYEAEPVERFFIGRYPTWGSMAPWGVVQVCGTYWLGAKMHRSTTWVRHIWWLPEAVAIGGNVGGTVNNIIIRR